MTLDLFAPEPREWRPPESLPDLSQHSTLWFDYEADGKDPHASKPTGLAICTADDQAWYLPFRHRGGNLDERMVRQWASSHAGLRGKTLVGSWAKIDAHFSRNWDLPLDALDVQLRDVQHQACLLDERRRKSGLDLLAHELCGEQKFELPFNLETTRMSEVHSSVVGPYAIQDVRLTRKVDLAQQPLITREGLDQVLDLEDSIILPVVEMEANGMPVDLALLETWRKEVRAAHHAALQALREAAGSRINPESFPDLKRLWAKLGLQLPVDPEDGAVSFSREALLNLPPHPIVPLVLTAKGLGSLLSKYLDKYANGHRDGVLRYNLHQLRADDSGTITGRFSAAAVDHHTGYGFNPQQVFHPKKQAKKLGTDRWPVRRLFIPAAGRTWVEADAKQIEYRLFAHLANNPRIIETFRKDPDVDYHDVVMEMVHATGVDMIRDHVKNVNFARLYGAGERKIARMLGKSPEDTRGFLQAYDRLMPEIKPLIQQISDQIVARARKEKVGYVKTLLGRRRRYHPDENGTLRQLHSGLNAWCQGTAADAMKIKLREVYRERKHLGLTMRVTVHDAIDGDLDNPEKAHDLRELLDEQSVALRVPVRWDVKAGVNWADAQRLRPRPALQEAA